MPDNQRQLTTDSLYDVIVVGAGVIGCAMARRFTLEGARVLVIEKSEDILDGASKGNSGILHTGFDAPPGSIEQQCITSGYEEFMQVQEGLGLPVLKTGALVVAWSEQEAEQLHTIQAQAFNNAVADTNLLDARQLAKKEPGLSKTAVAALEVPREYVIDPWTTPFVYLLQAIENGASLLRNAEVTAGQFDGNQWQLQTTQGAVKGKTLINCGGLYGDLLDQTLLQKTAFEIRPRKGQFLVFDKAASNLTGSIILPVPGKTTKGVVVCKTIYGNLLVGPTAEEQQSRDDASVQTETLKSLYKRGIEIVPELSGYTVTATYAGIRPATEYKDYCIESHPDNSYISVGGIRSTGLSAAPGIARYVYDLYKNMGTDHEALNNPVTPTVTPIADHLTRDWSCANNGGIVCHCELVSRREIQAALTGPLAACSLSALKRRTRVTMGRCQGFYCSAQLGEITAGYFSQPIGINDAKSG